MRNLISLLFIFCVSLSFGQQKITFSVVDSLTLKPIESASILINESVCCSSNNFGIVELDVTKIKVRDRITISKLGYEQGYFDFEGLITSPQKIFLKLKVIELEEVKVNTGKVERFTLGDPVSLTINNYLLRPNDQVATFIPGDRFGYVKEIKFNISNDLKGINQPFKMGLLRKGDDGKPASSLLKEDIMVYNPKGKSWIGVDLSDYRIELPKEGMFVVFQILPKEYYDEKQIWQVGSYFYRTPSPALRAKKKNERSYILMKQSKNSLNWHGAGRSIINLEVFMETE
jgi:hypothetical protein